MSLAVIGAGVQLSVYRAIVGGSGLRRVGAFQPARRISMDEEQVGGAVGRATGKAHDAAGEFLSDARGQVEGAVREVAGRAQEAYSDAKDMASGATAQVGRSVEHHPAVALLIAGALGYALGLLTAYATSARR
jgi:uncharacterized protein YjbJ (UPF0337 family)